MYAALVLMFITLLVNVFGSMIMLYAQRGNK
jgi:phosphate transport system permease protein